MQPNSRFFFQLLNISRFVVSVNTHTHTTIRQLPEGVIKEIYCVQFLFLMLDTLNQKLILET